MDKIRLGVLGSANIARRHIIPALAEVGGIELVAIASRNKDVAERLSLEYGCDGEYGYASLVTRSDIDAVYIPLPVGLHYDWTKRCLNEGKHVLVEKSFVNETTLASELITLASKKNLALFENFSFLYHSQHKLIAEKIESGFIGQLRGFRSSFGFPPRPRGDIRYKKELGGGALLDAGTYTIRSSQIFLGNDLRVCAGNLHFDTTLEIDIFGGAYLESQEGLFADVSFGFDNQYRCMYEIWGSKGTIIAERAFTAGPGIRPTVVIENKDGKDRLVLPPDNHFRNTLVEFCRTVRQRQLKEQQYRAISSQTKIIEAVNRVARRTIRTFDFLETNSTLP